MQIRCRIVKIRKAIRKLVYPGKQGEEKSKQAIRQALSALCQKLHEAEEAWRKMPHDRDIRRNWKAAREEIRKFVARYSTNGNTAEIYRMIRERRLAKSLDIRRPRRG